MQTSSRRLKHLPSLGLFALVLLLAGCDRCGDWMKSEGDKVPLACKGDGPKPN